MKGCEDFEVEIEMRLHGALASSAEPTGTVWSRLHGARKKMAAALST